MIDTGNLFILEGPDGVGKSTLARLLTERLNTAEHPCMLASFPGKEPGTLGHHVYELHHDPRKFDIHSLPNASLQLLHIAAHIDAIEKRLFPLLRSGTSIVLDRYWWSTVVYGLVAGVSQEVLDAMVQVESIYWNNLRPNTVFFITADAPHRKELDLASWRALASEYSRIADKEKKSYPVITINNVGSIDNALESIVSHIVNHPKRA